MMTWLHLWPVIILPLLALIGVGLIPKIELFGQTFSGAIAREVIMNHSLLSVLPHAQATRIVDAYRDATSQAEILLHILISLNLYTLVLPFLYLGCSLLIKVSAWHSATNLQLKQQALK